MESKMSFLSGFIARRRMGGLYRLDDRSLNDLGLNRYDLFDARHCRDAVGLLNSRRIERAGAWLS